MSYYLKIARARFRNLAGAKFVPSIGLPMSLRPAVNDLDLRLGEDIQAMDQGINGLIDGFDIALEHFLFLRGPGMDKLPKKSGYIIVQRKLGIQPREFYTHSKMRLTRS